MSHRRPSPGRRIVPPRPAALASGRLLATGEVARALGISHRTVLAWAQAGRLPSITTPGGHRRYPCAEVARAAARMGLAWATTPGQASRTQGTGPDHPDPAR